MAYAPPSWLFGPVWSALYLMIGVLAAAVALLIAWSSRRSRVAAWLLVPYLASVCFATALNAAIVVLN